MKFSSTLQRLLKLLAPYKARIIVAFVATAITAATEPTVAALMKELLDNGFVKAGFSIWLAPVFVVGIFMVRGMATFTAANWFPRQTCNRSCLEYHDERGDAGPRSVPQCDGGLDPR
jgi:ABC-type multidrug transport system fused ATPase/permease subunit